MDDNKSSPGQDQISSTVINASPKTSTKNSFNVLPSKSVEENHKKHKMSFMNQLRKRFSMHKKSKPKEMGNNDISDPMDKQIHSDKSNQNNTEKNNINESLKPDKRFSAIRRSIGKGKHAKDIEETDETQNKDSQKSHPNHIRPQSMHVANTCPPRYGYLASFGWYWGPLTRAEATQRLRHREDGCFLVRDSEGDMNKFTLSFKGAGQIFHNRILRHNSKYAFLPDEEFDSIPALIADAMRRSATSAYCFSRSTDVAPATPANNNNEAHNQMEVNSSAICSQGGSASGTANHKHEVRLLHPVSRYSAVPRSLYYLCRFMIRQYTCVYDLDKLGVTGDVLTYLQDAKYYL